MVRKTLVLLLTLLLPFSALALDPLSDLGIHGFLDLRGGMRLQEDATQRDTSVLESRLQLDYSHYFDSATLQLRGDLLADQIGGQALDLEKGRGWFDLREANLLFSPTMSMDVKVGRQILTWGTGDLLFINDLFPKDWQSFFIGRDQEYLKAPSDAIFTSIFPGWGTIDIVLMPVFDSDRYLRGERLSYWNPQLGRIAGRDAEIEADQPNDWFNDYELALRLSRNLSGYELALYGYRGFWKSPVGFDAINGRAYSSRLNVLGASVRGTLLDGIANAEIGYYDSRNDSSGSNPLLPNSELRLLIGYERELVSELTAAGQFYLEQLLDYSAYQASLTTGQPSREEYRQVLTLRLTRLLLQQTLTLSLFGYWSPTDEDYYLRPNLKYKLTDNWQLSAGGNLFGGSQPHTFFGQLEDNSNIYAGLRYSF